jgi:serine/threonine protein kinase/WD40 repeat protein
MTPEQYRRLSEAFDEVAMVSRAERERILAERFAGEPELRSEIDGLLAEHDRVDAPVATARGLEAMQDAKTTSALWPMNGEPVPVLKGAYRLLRAIGEGGMGVVYEAEQAFPRRRVALKSIRPGLSTPSMLRRFRTEIELLARLHHPGIAQIYEAGFVEERSPDQAFFVMELVDGLPLHRHVTARTPGTRDRLLLLLQLCDAVQHAHQRGVIHRDLKPGNILVTAAGQPKILDFGIARATDDPGDGTMATRAGQVIGTPSYMSPEQMFGEPVDTRSDVYALGVIAYELLTGTLPFDFSTVSIAEAARILREQTAAPLSRIDRGLRGDLEVIVATAMHADRERRYASAAAMAEDLRRHLDNRPIDARRDSAVYVLHKFARRHWAVVSLAIVLLASLVAFSVVSSVLAARNGRLAIDATRAQRSAEDESRRSGALSASLAEELTFARIDRGRAEAAAGKLKLAEDTLWKEYLTHPDLPAARWALWQTYHTLPCLWTAQGDPDTTTAAVSRDGRWIAMGTTGGVVIVRRTIDAGEVFRTDALGAAVASVAITSNGDLIALGLGDGRVGLLSTTGAPSPDFLSSAEAPVPHARGALSVSFSGNDAVLAIGGSDKRISLWDVASRTRTDVWDAHADAVTLVAVNRDGQAIASVGRAVSSGRKVWRKAEGSWISQDIPTRPNDHVSWIKFDRDDTLLYAFSGNEIDRLDIGTMQRTSVACALGGRVASGAASPDGTQYALGAAQTPFVFGEHLGAPPRSLGQQLGTVTAIGWVGPTQIVTVGRGGEVRLFDARQEVGVTRIKGFASWCFSGAWSTDGSVLSLDGGGTGIYTYDAKTLEPHPVASMPTSPLRHRGMEFFRNSDLVACGGIDGRVRIINVRTGTIPRTLGSHLPEVYSLAILRNQETLVTGHADGVIRVWDLASERVVKELPKLPRRVEAIALSPDGTLVASSGPTNAVQLLNAATWEPVGTLETSANPWGVAWSADGTTLFSTTHAGTLEVFDSASRTRRKLITAHQRLAPGLAVSPDGAIVATSSEDGSLRLWDSKSLRQLAVFDLGASELVHLAFDPSSRYLAVSAAWRQTIVVDLHAMDPFIEGNRAFQKARLAPQSGTAQ